MVVEPPDLWLADRRAEGYIEDVVWLMKKTIYGRRPAMQRWVDHLAAKLAEAGLERSAAHPSLFRSVSRGILLDAHADDFHGSAPDAATAEGFLAELGGLIVLETSVHARDGAEYEHLRRHRRHFLDHAVLRPHGRYVDEVLAALGLEAAKPAATPAVVGGSGRQSSQEENDDEEKLPPTEAAHYRSCLGLLLYVAADRWDIQRECSVLARALKEPTRGSMAGLRRLARYLRGTGDMTLRLRRSAGARARAARGGQRRGGGRGADEDVGPRCLLRVFSDSDWASAAEGRHSRSSWAIEANGSFLASGSRRQGVITTSSGEAELYAATGALSEGLGMAAAVAFAGFSVRLELCLDSAAARGILKREGLGKLKHIDVRCLWAQQVVKSGRAFLATVAGDDNPADLGTKPLARPRLRKLCLMMGMMCSAFDEEEAAAKTSR